MDSDLSLIEIAGEDDSLLQQIPTLDDTTTTTANATYFSCSPIQILRSNRSAGLSRGSPIKGWKNNVDFAKPSCSSPKGSSNKENINMNKSEVPKLSVERQKMKRTKKGGGYNLRKSLAWDKAFFTEEGVLNPVELSMLSGNFGNSCGEVLSVIHEEGRESLSGDSDSTSDTTYLPALEGNLSKEILPTKDKDNAGSSFMKHHSSGRDNAASTSVATPKVLSNYSSRIGSKGGVCPRPFAISSLKRPANASIGKASLKESKLPKIPFSKTGHCSLPTTSKSAVLGTSHSKQNQIAQSDEMHSECNQIAHPDYHYNVQKNAGLKGSSKNTKSAPNKAKAGPGYTSLSANSSLRYSRRNTVNSPLEKRSSTNPRPVLVSKANGGLEVILDPVLRPSGTNALEGHDVSRKTGVSLPQNTQCIGGNIQYTQVQTTKPSGLRMPSPSLGFFGQTKSSASHSLPQRIAQPCNLPESRNPNLRKIGASNCMRELRPPHAPRKMPKVANNATSSGNASVLGSSMEFSVPSAVNDVSRENMQLNLEVNNVQMVEVKVPCDPKSSELIKNNHEVHHIINVDNELVERVEPDRVEQISDNKDTECKVKDNELLLHSGSCDQFKKDSNQKETIICPECRDSDGSNLENPNFISQHGFVLHGKGVCGTNDMIEHQHVEDKEYSSSVKNHGVIFEPQSGNSISDIEHDSLVMHNDSLGTAHDVNEQFGEPDELINPSAGKTDPISHGENHSLKTNDGILLEDIKSSDDSQKYDSGNIADVNANVRASSGSEMESCCGQSQHESTGQANEDAAGVENLTNKLHVEDVQVRFLDSILSVESCNSNLSTSAMHNQYLIADDVCEQSGEHLELHSPCHVVEQISHLRHGLLSDDYLLLAESVPSGESREVNACESVVYAVAGRSDDCGSEPESAYVIITQEAGPMQDSGVVEDEMVVQPHVEETLSGPVEIVPSFENRDNPIDTQFNDDIKLSGEASLGFHLSLTMSRDHTTGSLTSNSKAFCSLSKELGSLVPSAQTSLNGSTLEGMGVSGLKDNIVVEEAETKICSDNFHEENQRLKTNDGILFQKSRSFEESQTEDLKNTADVNPIAQGSTRSKTRSFHSPSQLKNTVHAYEGAAGVDDMTNKSHVGDAKVYSLDANPSVGSCNSSLSTSAEQNLYPMVVADVNEQLGEQPKLRNPCLVDEYVSQDNHGLHLNDYLLLRKSTSSEEPQNENVLESVAHVPEQSDVVQVPPAIQDGGVEMEKMAEHPYVEDAPSGENHKHVFIDTEFRNEMEVHGQAISSEESGLSVEGAQTSSTENGVLGVGVDRMKSILPEEFEAKISQNITSPVGELHCELDNIMGLTESDDATKPIKKSENGMKRDNHLTKKPPVNAVPFSDEWLAAMEAAGEDILTMKSGAVQNSPPDKSVPEPSPWSPVKRKSNQIGPFECTKFTNILPSNSH